MKKRSKKILETEKKGFSLIEVIIGIALVGIALLGLAHLFTLSMMNNSRSDEITTATFLAQQRIDSLRNLTLTEITSLASPSDELIDVNSDTVNDFRRITVIQDLGFSYQVRVMVFSETEFSKTVGDLTSDPEDHRVKADITTIISRT